MESGIKKLYSSIYLDIFTIIKVSNCVINSFCLQLPHKRSILLRVLLLVIIHPINLSIYDRTTFNIESELRDYDQNESIESFDVFWNKIQEKNELPFLRNLVKSLLCGKAGIHSSESQFSYTNNMMWASRNRLHHKKLEMISFCHRNLDMYVKKQDKQNEA